ncbi:MAG: hypothetical protein V4472_24870 [Pseudomonadota bacterium]
MTTPASSQSENTPTIHSAKTLGAIVTSALIESAEAQFTLRQIQEWINHWPHEDDNETTAHIRLLVDNWFAPGRTFLPDDLVAAMYQARLMKAAPTHEAICGYIVGKPDEGSGLSPTYCDEPPPCRLHDGLEEGETMPTTEKVRVDDLEVGDTLTFEGHHAVVTNITRFDLAMHDRPVRTSMTQDNNRWPVVSISLEDMSGIVRFPYEELYRIKRRAAERPLTAVDSVRRVLADREKELFDLKGPCSNSTCRLHHAHSGPCDTEGIVRQVGVDG